MPAGLRNPIRWIGTPADLETIIGDDLSFRDVIGLDVETRLDFQTLALIQISTRSTNYLIDALTIRDLSPLTDVFEVARPLKIIHNAKFEHRVLAERDLELCEVFDTMVESRTLRGWSAPGGHTLAAVCWRELGLDLAKDEQISDWGRRPLTEAQMRYAAHDAEVLLPLFDKFGGRVGVR